MGVYVSGMKMPKSCDECAFIHSSWGIDYYCPLAKDYQYQSYISEHRMESCPLIEIHPHGDLIDANKLVELCDIMADKCDGIGVSVWHQFKTTVEWSPIVIPAEEGE